MRVGPCDEKICIGAQPQCLERPSVATCVSAQPDGGRYWRAAPRARTEPIDRASSRRCGPATTPRFDRDRSRGERPNDLVAMLGPWRRWRGGGGSPRRDWAGARAPPTRSGRSSGARHSPSRRHSILSLRANARVQLRAVGSICALSAALRKIYIGAQPR